MATVWRSQCAFARFFIGKIVRIPNNSSDLGAKLSSGPLAIACGSRNYSNYAHSPFVRKVKEQYDYERHEARFPQPSPVALASAEGFIYVAI
ncbi:unnamed protein product, partial [Iphiclides podalirius]